MDKIIKYGFPVTIGANVACAIMNVVLSHYTLGMNQASLAMFMFLYYKKIKK
jgi:hypothetical protein